ncbi:TlpA family protein disulfide reductase [Sanyastnella coralliicola]|uniref:TlpA family protein disulfide reductase n=1 Tax=Sanyastnella coralliicola TaxID=3069118 RepID=UPI0027B92AB0|nr:TlpA disulfide reductase family protein [Longitalea sp. SCSIO 12813]
MKRIFPYLLIGLVLLGFYYWRYKVPPSMDTAQINVKVSEQVKSVIELHDGPILVNFYASWCGPCMREMPSLQKAHDKGLFTVVCVTDDNPQLIEQVRNKFDLTFPMYQLDNSLKSYSIYTIPTTYLLNEDGEVVASMTDPREWDSEDFMNKAKDWLSY